MLMVIRFKNTNNLRRWLRNTHLKTNAGRLHLLVTGNSEASTNIKEFHIESIKKK